MTRGSNFYRHGLGHTPFNNVYFAMRRRCTNPKNRQYHLYGGRGIKCEWLTFGDFMDDMYLSYKEHVEKFGRNETQIDRIDPDGNYCKSNCRWATRSEQARNRRNIYPVEYKGRTMLLTDWSKELGINFFTLYNRIYTYGWSIEKAFDPKKRINQFL